MSNEATVPDEGQLKAAIVAIKSANPAAGIAKVHTLLREQYPVWSVGEKRTRKILQTEGLIVGPAVSENVDNIFPSSRTIAGLDLVDKKVYVHKFNKKKGKGLCASEAIADGEVIWRGSYPIITLANLSRSLI